MRTKSKQVRSYVLLFFTRINLACAIVTSGSFIWGVRTAWKQAKPLKPHELSNSNLMGGIGFAFRALGLATVITVSGFGFFIVGVSALMNVNTPKQVNRNISL
jgi:hypothetical protein